MGRDKLERLKALSVMQCLLWAEVLLLVAAVVERIW